MSRQQDKIGRWYFGGLASAGAACCTHPLDLLKVHLQTQQHGRLSIGGMAIKVIRTDGIFGLYNGLSASLLRQFTYSLTRFGLYETMKKHLTSTSDTLLPFYQKVLLAGISGAAGGFVGTPGDLVNVRMQNDVKLSAELRRNYKHALDGVYRIWTHEGFRSLFNGATMATNRGAIMNIGQLAFYDQIKQTLIVHTTYFDGDRFLTHFVASFGAASIATIITQPLDVLKTRMMNAKVGEFTGLIDCCKYTLSAGPLAFFKGFIPSWIRLAPHTIILFVIYEQLRLNFGNYPTIKIYQ